MPSILHAASPKHYSSLTLPSGPGALNQITSLVWDGGGVLQKGREERVTLMEIQQRLVTSQGTASPSLFDRIGGLASIAYVVDRFIDKLRLDPELATALATVDVASFKRAQAAFFAEALGGRFPNKRVDPRRVYLELEAEPFLRALLFLHDALVEVGLPASLHEEVVLAVMTHTMSEGS